MTYISMSHYTIISMPVSTPIRRELPLLFINNELFLEQVGFIRHLSRSQHSSATLHRVSALIGMFWQFCQFQSLTHATLKDLPTFFTSFIETRIFGSKELGWAPVSGHTASADSNALAEFFDYYNSHYNTAQANPLTLQPHFEDLHRRQQTDMLFYLFGHTKAAQGIKLKRTFRIPVAQGEMLTEHPELAAVIRLVHLASTRDKLLWMLLAYGGVRGSEAINLMVHDISVYPDGQACIKLKHPIHSEDTFQDPITQKLTTGKRQEYLRTVYALSPRPMLSKDNPLYAGWKGMYYEDRKKLTSYVHWVTPAIGRAWAELHLQYMTERLPYMSKHPYYFINLRSAPSDNNVGLPMKMGNLRNIFQHQSAAAGFTAYTGLNKVHSLRHFYKWVLKEVGGLNDVTIMRCMHHRSLLSTSNYGVATPEELNAKLIQAYDRFKTILPDT